MSTFHKVLKKRLVFSVLDLADEFSEMLDQRRAFIGGEWREANSG